MHAFSHLESAVRRRPGRRALLLGSATLLAVSSLPAPASAAVGTVVARQLTSPGALLELGNDTNGYTTWVSDHLLGFCRVDGVLINQATCSSADTAPGRAAASPGQASFDRTANKVYVPDNSAKSAGVYQLDYDPVNKVITDSRLFGSGAGGIKANGSAVYNGMLFVSNLKNGNILRIGTGNALSSYQTLGQTSDGRAPTGLAVSGDMLYLAEGAGVSTLDATQAAVRTGLRATFVDNPDILAPSAIAAAADAVYVTEVDEVTGAGTLIRWKFDGTVENFAAAGAFPTAVSVTRDNAGATTAVLAADSPSDGASVQDGRGFRYAPGDPARRILGTVPLPHSGGAGGGGGTPPPAAADGTQVATVTASGPAAPTGYLTLGGEPWVVTQSGQVCKVGTATCFASGATVAGQASSAVVGTTTYLLIPDRGTAGGVLRVTWSPTGLSDPRRLGQGLSNPMAASAVSGGTVIVGGPQNGNLLGMPVTDPTVKPVTMGKVASPITGMARTGGNLLVTSSTGTQLVANIAGCSPKCVGSATPITPSGGAPTAVASDGADLVFIASGAVVEKFDLGAAGGHDARYVATYLVDATTTPPTTAAIGRVSGLGVSGTSLHLGDGVRSYSAPTS